MLTVKKINRVKLVLWISIVCSIFGGVFAALKFGPLTPFIVKGVLLGFTLSCVCGLMQFLYFEQALKRVSFTKAVLIRSAAFSAITVLIFVAVSVLISKTFAIPYYFKNLPFVLLVTFVLAGIGILSISTVNLIGKREFLSIMTGRYHRPVEEERAFMFLDLASSTAIAEKIGHSVYLDFLNECYSDITEAIAASGGEIYKYVGDEIIVVWKVRRDGTTTAPLDCYTMIVKAIENRRVFYEQRFGFVPVFRAGLHYGTVIVGELGDTKKEIAYIGDVLNTTSRIQEECKQLGVGILISGDAARLLGDPSGYRLVSHGRKRLRGKDAQVELFGIQELTGTASVF